MKTKKTFKNQTLVALAIGIILSSCNIERRLYMSNYHVSWKHKNQYVAKHKIERADQDKTIPSLEKISIKNNDSQGLISSNKSFDEKVLKSERNKITKHKKKITEECDIITLNSGEELRVKVLEIGHTEIKYKKCDNLNGPTITINKNTVFSIKYPNGTKDIISNTTNTTVNKTTEKKSTTEEDSNHALAILSLVLSILSIPASLVPILGFLLGLGGLLFGLACKNDKLGKAGMILGGIGIFLSILMFFIFLLILI